MDSRKHVIVESESLPRLRLRTALRKLYDTTPNFTRGEYLELIQTVDPQQVRKLVLEDMQTEHPTLLYDQIHILGNELMPKLDHLLADRLGHSRRDGGGSLRTFALLSVTRRQW